MKKQEVYYKGARPDGFDFYTGTINYRENIGKIVKVPHSFGIDRPVPPKVYRLCSSDVLHASKAPPGVFLGSKIPLSLYRVSGTPVVEDEEKSGFREFLVKEEIPASKFDELFGFRYSEVAVNPLDPRKIDPPPQIERKEQALLKKWASVRDSVRASVWASVRDSVWDSVWASVRDSVWVSVRDSEAAYIGSLFFKVKEWKYTEQLEIKRGYPFQSCVELLKRGLVPCTDGEKWYIVHPRAEGKAKIVWSGIIGGKRTGWE